MTSGCSLPALQWLTYLQESDSRLVDSDGVRVKIENKYYRGEKKFRNWFVDGFALVNGKMLFYEFLGCYFHRGCQNSKCRNFDPSGVDEVFERKKLELSEYGEVITIRECEWESQIRKIRKIPSPSFPDIFNTFSNEKKLLNQIEKGEIFGFLVADVTTPPDVLEKILPLNFPPIIQRGDIEESMLSDYMRGRCEAREKKLPQTTLIQTYHATQLTIYTPTVKFYMELGLEISNVTKFIQFLPTKPLNNFVDKITKGRIDAEKNGNRSLGTSFKIVGKS